MLNELRQGICFEEKDMNAFLESVARNYLSENVQ